MAADGGEAAQLLEDIAVERRVELPGGRVRYGAELSGAWSFFTPSGGVLTSVALRAMEAWVADELGDGWRALSSTTIFYRAVPEGALEVDLRVLRRGNTATQLRASVGPAGGEHRMQVSATFVRARSGPTLVARAYPEELPGPAESEPYWRGRPPMAFFRQLETRLAHGRRFWEDGWEPGPARMARWFRYHRSPTLGGRLALAAHPPLVDTMPAAIFEHLGSEHSRLFAPSLDLTVHYLADTPREWILAHARGIWAEDGWASADIELWDDERRLLAFGTQTMMLREAPTR